MNWEVRQGDCREVLGALPEASVQCCVTSPPYWGLRSYVPDGDPLKPLELGLEATPEEYVVRMVDVFREVRRALRPDGTLWLNLGDCYASSGGGGWQGKHGARANRTHTQRALKGPTSGLEPKNLVGIPWRVAFALQADGWWLRSDIIWHKPNPMPESVTDRPTSAHEHVFLLAKSASYFYNADAIRESFADERQGNPGTYNRTSQAAKGANNERGDLGFLNGGCGWNADGSAVSRNARSVWTISTKPFSGAHFAVMPWDLAERCVLAGSSAGSTILDPFAGAGTVGMVAARHGRSFVGIELSPAHAEMARARIEADAPLLNRCPEVA